MKYNYFKITRFTYEQTFVLCKVKLYLSRLLQAEEKHCKITITLLFYEHHNGFMLLLLKFIAPEVKLF